MLRSRGGAAWFAGEKTTPEFDALLSRVHGQPPTTAIEALVFVADHLHDGQRLCVRIRFMGPLDHPALGRADGSKEVGVFRQAVAKETTAGSSGRIDAFQVDQFGSVEGVNQVAYECNIVGVDSRALVIVPGGRATANSLWCPLDTDANDIVFLDVG